MQTAKSYRCLDEPLAELRKSLEKLVKRRDGFAFPFAGITRIRFKGYVLSLSAGTPKQDKGTLLS